MTPKILHQTGPTDRTSWHPLWIDCQESLQRHFPDWEYRFWNDEDIDRLVHDHYPQYWDLYQSFPIHIMQIDFVRWCILHRHGGLYVDLDIFCYQNFENFIGPRVTLIGNPLGNDPVENSLMASIPAHDYWLRCMKECRQRNDYTRRSYPQFYESIVPLHLDNIRYHQEHPDRSYLRPWLVFYITGTNLVATVARSMTSEIDLFPGHLFCNHELSYHPDFCTKHLHTGTWGRENIELISDLALDYSKKSGIDIKDFDLYHDYTKDRFLKEDVLDTEKNAGHEINTHSSRIIY